MTPLVVVTFHGDATLQSRIPRLRLHRLRHDGLRLLGIRTGVTINLR